MLSLVACHMHFEYLPAVTECWHIVSFKNFHKIVGAQPETFPNVKYEDPEEVGGDRKCF